MNKPVLALAFAALALAPLAVAHAASITYLSTSASLPTVLDSGETGTAAFDEDTSGASVLNSHGTADYYFKLQAPASQLTSYLEDLDSCYDVSSSIKAISGTTLTAVPEGGVIKTTFNLIPGTEYELVVKGKPKTSFVADLRVAVTAAPEPAAWALMVFGIGAIGVSMRRPIRGASTDLVPA
jgi:hypothetical protein